jgi:hypothetical protein
MTPARRYRCRYCGREFPAWLPVAQAPDRPMLVHHLSFIHPEEVGPYLARMRTEDIATVAAEAYEVVESDEDGSSSPAPAAGRSGATSGLPGGFRQGG